MGQSMESGFDTMVEYLIMVYYLSNIDFGPIPTDGVASPYD